MKKYLQLLIIAVSILIASCNNAETKTVQDAGKTTGDPIQEINATNSRTQFAEINNKKIAYRSIGKGDPIILCQRFRGNLDDWDPAFLDELARHYTVIIFDYTGMGSSVGTPHTNMLEFAKDAVDLADALKIEKFIIGGWSLGGWAAQLVTTEFPDRVAQTILIGTKPPGKVNHLFEDIFQKTAYIFNNTLEHEEILFFEPISAFSRAAAAKSHARIAARTIDKEGLVKQELWKHYGMGGEDFVKDPYHAREKLTTTSIPILVISGDHEICFPPENWFELNRKLPTTQVVVIPRTGHAPHHQYPEMVTSYIHTFLDDNKRAGTSH